MVYHLSQQKLDFPGGVFLAPAVGHKIGKEELERIDTEVGLHILAARNARHSGDVHSRTLGYVLQYHGAQTGFVAVLKERAL